MLSQIRRLKNGAKRNVMLFKYKLESRNILEVKLQGGLCNKLFCLFAACELAKKNKFQILEPQFGWHQKIYFSDIYDLDHFNTKMFELTGIENLMVARVSMNNKNINNRIRYDFTGNIDYWDRSEKMLLHLRKNEVIYSNSMMVNVLKALKLRAQFHEMADTHLNHEVGLQIRIESDWAKYALTKKVGENEILLIDPDELVLRLKDFKVDKLCFTTGENHKLVQAFLEYNKISSSYFFDNLLEYEINAAINFEIMCHTQKFIGLSRSSFSNLISLKRHLILNNSENYVYNYGDKIEKRVDVGLYPEAKKSISVIPQIV